MIRSRAAAVRAAWWALRTIRTARRNVEKPDFGAGLLPLPPRLDGDAGRGVRAVLRRRPQSCLVRSLVLQRWYAGQGDHRDLVIGVTAPDRGFHAHAWLEGERGHEESGFVELLRRPAR